MSLRIVALADSVPELCSSDATAPFCVTYNYSNYIGWRCKATPGFWNVLADPLPNGSMTVTSSTASTHISPPGSFRSVQTGSETQNISNSTHSGSSSLSRDKVIGIAVGVPLALLIICAVLVWLQKARKRTERNRVAADIPENTPQVATSGSQFRGSDVTGVNELNERRSKEVVQSASMLERSRSVLTVHPDDSMSVVIEGKRSEPPEVAVSEASSVPPPFGNLRIVEE